MRGPYQESRRIPHSLKELPQNPSGLKWQVTLHPHDHDPINCVAGRTIDEAIGNANATIAVRYPGATL